jgi:hypothetical protein
MKKLILFILLFAYINTKAQDFNGINLDQTYTEVSNQLKKKGFKYVKKDQTYHVFNGELQYDPVKLGVEPLGSKIKSFAVLINPKNTWEDIEKDYYYYRKRLIEKYGEPYVDKQEFNYPYKLGDGYELLALTSKNCNYVSLFGYNEWIISITLVEKQVVIIYINKKLNKNENSI